MSPYIRMQTRQRLRVNGRVNANTAQYLYELYPTQLRLSYLTTDLVALFNQVHLRSDPYLILIRVAYFTNEHNNEINRENVFLLGPHMVPKPKIAQVK